MPFRAILDGEHVLSLRIAKEAWASFARRVKAGEDVVRMRCCNSPGIPKISPLGRPFFAHKAQPAECNWKPVSLEHIELQAAAYEAVLAADGWSGKIEDSGPNWRADVLATRGKVRVAFEIQLSAQGQAKTLFREDRYEDATVLPWWIVTSRRNSGSGFGSGLRSILQGENLTAMTLSTRQAVHDVLRRVESQVRIAEAIALYFRNHGISYNLTKFCSIPVSFSLVINIANTSKDQVIVIGKLGADALPELQNLRKQSPENYWGTAAQIVRYAPQIKGFGSTAFFLKKILRRRFHHYWNVSSLVSSFGEGQDIESTLRLLSFGIAKSVVGAINRLPGFHLLSLGIYANG